MSTINLFLLYLFLALYVIGILVVAINLTFCHIKSRLKGKRLSYFDKDSFPQCGFVDWQLILIIAIFWPRFYIFYKNETFYLIY